MNATIQKWGNSQGIRLPKIILDQLGFLENDKVEITINDDSIILKKTNKQKHITVEQRLQNFYGKPINRIETIEQVEDLDWGKPVGEEAW